MPYYGKVYIYEGRVLIGSQTSSPPGASPPETGVATREDCWCDPTCDCYCDVCAPQCVDSSTNVPCCWEITLSGFADLLYGCDCASVNGTWYAKQTRLEEGNCVWQGPLDVDSDCNWLGISVTMQDSGDNAYDIVVQVTAEDNVWTFIKRYTAADKAECCATIGIPLDSVPSPNPCDTDVAACVIAPVDADDVDSLCSWEASACGGCVTPVPQFMMMEITNPNNTPCFPNSTCADIVGTHLLGYAGGDVNICRWDKTYGTKCANGTGYLIQMEVNFWWGATPERYVDVDIQPIAHTGTENNTPSDCDSWDEVTVSCSDPTYATCNGATSISITAVPA